MGIEIAEAKFLRAYKQAGYPATRTLTLGKQDNWLSEREMLYIFGQTGNIWDIMGADTVDILDIQPLKGVKHIVDLDHVVELTDKYDLIYDGGTIEHCFSYLQALQNALNMLNPEGGSLLMATPTSNYSGHGFWQPSPELFFDICMHSALSMQTMWLAELAPTIKYYGVRDPNTKRRRTDFISRWPCMLYVWIRRYGNDPIHVHSLATVQSDYGAQLKGHATPEQTGYIDRWSNPKYRRLKLMLRTLAPGLAGWLQRWRFGRLPLSKNPCFTRIHP